MALYKFFFILYCIVLLHSKLKIRLSAGLRLNLLGALTSLTPLPRPHSWIKGAASRQGRGGEGRGRWEKAVLSQNINHSVAR